MKYFLDTEFIEGFHKPLFGKKRHFIDLISIGIVCEDGRTYYAVSSEFNPKNADDWVRKNVILPCYMDIVYVDSRNIVNENNFHIHFGKSNNQIAFEVKKFFGYKPELTDYGSDEFTDDNNIEVYAYYADYDWVVFCSLFGRMIDLPKGMPMYCKDLKQILDEKVDKKDWYYGRDIWSNTRKEGEVDLQEKDRPATLEEKLDKIKRHNDYPKQDNEHNALDDARWNFRLHNFLNDF